MKMFSILMVRGLGSLGASTNGAQKPSRKSWGPWGRGRQEVHDQTKPGMIWIKIYEIMVGETIPSGELTVCYGKWP